MVEYRVKGAMFANTKERGPAFSGFVEIDGVKTNIALWPKRSAAGADYLQVSENKKMEQGSSPAPRQPQMNSPIRPRDPPSGRSEMDDDVPF